MKRTTKRNLAIGAAAYLGVGLAYYVSRLARGAQCAAEADAEMKRHPGTVVTCPPVKAALILVWPLALVPGLQK